MDSVYTCGLRLKSANVFLACNVSLAFSLFLFVLFPPRRGQCETISGPIVSHWGVRNVVRLAHRCAAYCTVVSHSRARLSPQCQCCCCRWVFFVVAMCSVPCYVAEYIYPFFFCFLLHGHRLAGAALAGRFIFEYARPSFLHRFCSWNAVASAFLELRSMPCAAAPALPKPVPAVGCLNAHTVHWRFFLAG